MTADAKVSFRQRLRAREYLAGTMLKTPACQPTEILGDVGFDFVVVDQEHSPFDRASTDLILLAARATALPALVRVPGPDNLLTVLDCGASGVVVPHVVSAAYAAEVASLCRYRGGKRGYATSTRSGSYTAIPMGRHIKESDEMVAVIGQIEDPCALDDLDSIAAVEGIDALFVGRNDLALGLGEESPDSPVVRRAVERIAIATLKAGKAFGVFVAGAGEIEWLKSLGATGIVFSSDQGFLRHGAIKALTDIRTITRSST